jgi:catechol 2,3-dioxygenase-like lactoylglutathione lyase family enzyme
VANQELEQHVSAIHHVGITVAELDRSLGFYCSLLGLPLIGISEEEEVGAVVGLPGARARIADIDVGNGQLLELLEYRTGNNNGSPSPANTVGTSHLSLRVHDLASALSRLAAEGIAPLGDTARLSGGVWEGSIVVYLRDPDGMIVELIESPCSP